MIMSQNLRTSAFILLILFLSIGSAAASTGCKDAPTNLEVAISNREYSEEARNLACEPMRQPRRGYSQYNSKPSQLCLNSIQKLSHSILAVEKAADFFETCKRNGRL